MGFVSNMIVLNGPVFARSGTWNLICSVLLFWSRTMATDLVVLILIPAASYSAANGPSPYANVPGLKMPAVMSSNETKNHRGFDAFQSSFDSKPKILHY